MVQLDGVWLQLASKQEWAETAPDLTVTFVAIMCIFKKKKKGSMKRGIKMFMRINKVLYRNIRKEEVFVWRALWGRWLFLLAVVFPASLLFFLSVLQNRRRKWYESYYLLMCQPSEWRIFRGLQAQFLWFVNHFCVHNFQDCFKYLSPFFSKDLCLLCLILSWVQTWWA